MVETSYGQKSCHSTKAASSDVPEGAASGPYL